MVPLLENYESLAYKNIELLLSTSLANVAKSNFRTQLNICDGTFSIKLLQKISILDVRLGSKYASGRARGECVNNQRAPIIGYSSLVGPEEKIISHAQKFKIIQSWCTGNNSDQQNHQNPNYSSLVNLKGKKRKIKLLKICLDIKNLVHFNLFTFIFLIFTFQIPSFLLSPLQ